MMPKNLSHQCHELGGQEIGAHQKVQRTRKSHYATYMRPKFCPTFDDFLLKDGIAEQTSSPNTR